MTFKELENTLADIYTRTNNISDVKTYTVKGDTIIFWPTNTELPIKISFFDTNIDDIDFIDLKIQKNQYRQNILHELNQSNSKEYLKETYTNSNTWLEFIIQIEINCKINDYLVHEDHGVAKFVNIVKRDQFSYLLLQYAGDDKLYIPLNQLEKITKFVGASGIAPRVTRLSGGEWNRILNKVKESTASIAKDLLLQLALREIHEGPKISIATDLYEKFCEDFAYSLTYDQEKTMQEIEHDLNREITVSNQDTKKFFSMNRLLIGDVGFGKTEMAIRTTFRVAESGYQVAVLCPTTILAAQHYKLFSGRLNKYGLSVCMLSSFQNASRNRELVEMVNNGKYDVVIGTHRLLSNDVKFKNLGLIVIDEEQRFGVKQKEKIKSLKYGVHILTMSATPIPRTLSMALSKLQDISTITTPPTGRRSIITQIISQNIDIICEKINFEIERNGQVYLIHNNIETMASLKQKLLNINPRFRIGIAYSGMIHLEETILKFYNQEYDVLLSTTILENGIDMPNVNTIIINNAQNFGLSELHQLRGRVGRSNIQAYCYLATPRSHLALTKDVNSKQLTDTQFDRIITLSELSSLGSGFQIAEKDLEFRGAGNILGKEQSGNINLVGYGLYLKLLEDEVSKLSIK